jgi:formamidopyrimidine-DNA glycosylase
VPELPEVAAHAERLSTAFAGNALARFEPLHPAALKTFDPRPAAVTDRVLASVGNRGKYLLLRFDGSDDGSEAPKLTFVVHLMQGGRLRADTQRARKLRGGMARWTFAGSAALLLTEAGTERRAGVWLVAGDPAEVEPLARLGPDADTISREELARRLASAGERVHGFLRDQSHLAGIGRLLANEVLHSARISPFSNTSRLDGEAVDRLHAAIGQSIERGLAAERKLDDMGRSADRPNDVHHRVGKECPACGDIVRAVEYRRYRVAYCPGCQTGGKVLADNTTSRFLK